MVNQDVWLKVAASLASLLILAFTAWAGVVWNSAGQLRSMLEDIHHDIIEVKVDLEAHKGLAAHPRQADKFEQHIHSSGLLMQHNKTRMESHERRLDKLEQNR